MADKTFSIEEFPRISLPNLLTDSRRYSFRGTKSLSNVFPPRRSSRFTTKSEHNKILVDSKKSPKRSSRRLKLLSLNDRFQRRPAEKATRRPEEVYRMSYPCRWGCPKCAFTSCLGPVKVYISRYNMPKERFIPDISDGRGIMSFPKSRRKEIKGLVYDKDSSSLFPQPPKDIRKDHMTSRQKIIH